MGKVKIIMFCMLDLYRWFVYVNCEREEATEEPATPRGCLDPRTYFSLTKNTLFKRLKFQAPLTKEGLKLVLRLKIFSQGYPY